jgi:hypothetical protein
MLYYQHIGERLWQRDGPESVGSPKRGTHRFHIRDIEPYLEHVPASERAAATEAVGQDSPDGFQIWGLPEPAGNFIRKMGRRDTLLLLESDSFRYVGRVLHKFSLPCWDLSRHIWGEQKFPWIVLLSGQMVQYPWYSFVADFSYNPNYDWRRLQGRTNRVADAKLHASRFVSEHRFIDEICSKYAE